MTNADARKVLIIETDATNVELLEGMLEEEFSVMALCPEESEQEILKSLSPDAAILNPGEVDLDIALICKTLKHRNPEAYIIYLDEEESLERQISVYDDGVDDYLSKPFNPIEIYHKIKTNINIVNQTIKLMDQADHARSMAFNMMEANSELGTILRFIEEVIATKDYDDLGTALVNAGENFDIFLAVQLRAHVGNLNFRCDSNSDIAKLLSAATVPGQIIENGRRLILSRGHVAFFATKLPKEEEKYGRLKDNLSILLKAADAKMSSLLVELSLEDERDALLKAVMDKVTGSMKSIKTHYESHETDIRLISQEFKDHMESVLMAIDLDEKQEDALTRSIDAFLNRMMDTEATKALIESSFNSLLLDLKRIT
ncbi:MAG: response regulator [Pseudomonadales bacterium]|nr:response regulator [Pseudomonadales bacterium]